MPLYKIEYPSEAAQLKARYWGAFQGMGASEYCASLANQLQEPSGGLENVDWAEVERIKKRAKAIRQRNQGASID
jgi:hypothetical protein